MPQAQPDPNPQTKPDQQQGNPPTPMPPRRTWGVLLLILLINFLLFRLLFPSPDLDTVPYTVFKQEAAEENVEAVYSRGERITGRFRTAVTYPAETDTLTGAEPRSITTFETTLPTFLDPGLEALLISGGTEIRAEPIEEGTNPFWMLLFGFGPALLLIGLYVWVGRRIARSGGMGGMMGGMRNLGQSTARRFDEKTDDKVTFDDVAGIDEAENELVEVVDFLKNPEKYTRLGGTAPKGVLLVGPPGTGKTLLARAVAGEAGVAFFSMSGSEFVEMIVGVGAARVRDLFKQAREHAPAIVFIDEIDSIGRARGQEVVGGVREQE